MVSSLCVCNSSGSLLRSFQVQMAPLSVMPHAVHLFLEQVSHGLWDNSWFYINSPHVLQIGPQVEEGDAESENDHPRAVSLRPFRELSLETLSFPEYSEEFPHDPWTLGFTGRPGGPDFYINKVDNRKAHGPGGQYHHELDEFADSCFAKVIKGFDTLEDIAKIATILEGDYKHFFEFPVHIVKTVILHNSITVEEADAVNRIAGFGNIKLRANNDDAEDKVRTTRQKQGHFPKPEIEDQVEP
jgi:cyclophilin family peptidyl-prolyl cis-trans isomerase